MFAGISFLGVVALIPFFVAAMAGARCHRLSIGVALTVVGAIAPNLALFAATQQADGISRSASVALMPVLCLFSLFVAYLGYLAGRGWSGR